MWKAISEAVQKLFESTELLLIVLGILVVIFGAAGGVTYNNWFPISQQWAQIFVSIVGLLFALCGVLFVLVKPRSARPYGISITSPTRGAQIKRTNVTGTIRKLPPKEYKLWILRIYPTDEYQPLRKISLNKGQKDWEARDCDIGGKPGESRRLGACLIGPTSQILFEYFLFATDRHNRMMDELNVPQDKKDRWLPPLKEFGEDMIMCDAVDVIRSQ